MAEVLISPGRCVQGAGEMKGLGACAEGYGTKALILISEDGCRRIGKGIGNSLTETGCTFIFDYFHGECSRHEIERLRGIMKKNTYNLVIGIGGGRIFDTAKAVAHYEKAAVSIRPIIASTDAPRNTLSVIYIDEGVFEEYFFLPANPDLVLMDTDIIVKSPVRLTVAGVGDAPATYFEAWACEQSGTVNYANGKVTGAAMVLTKLYFKTLMEESVKTKLASEADVCTPAIEEIIEASTLSSGIDFENADLAGAHTVHNGLTVLEECHRMYHGEGVAFGTIVQLVLENVEVAELQETIEFCTEFGLPVTLGELGAAEIIKEKIMAVAEAACTENDTLHNMPFEVTPDKMYAAIIAADAYGRYFLNES